MKNLPEEHKTVNITYIGKVRVRNKYYDHEEERQVTRKAVYSKSSGYYDKNDNYIETPNGYFSVPQYWKKWTFSDGTTSLLPHGFYSYPRVMPEDVIKWEEI